MSSNTPLKSKIQQINTEINNINTEISTLIDERETKADNLTLALSLSAMSICSMPLATYLVHGLYDIHARFKKEDTDNLKQSIENKQIL